MKTKNYSQLLKGEVKETIESKSIKDIKDLDVKILMRAFIAGRQSHHVKGTEDVTKAFYNWLGSEQ